MDIFTQDNLKNYSVNKSSKKTKRSNNKGVVNKVEVSAQDRCIHALTHELNPHIFKHLNSEEFSLDQLKPCNKCEPVGHKRYCGIVNAGAEFSYEVFNDSLIDQSLILAKSVINNSAELDVYSKIVRDFKMYTSEKVYTPQLEYESQCYDFLVNQQKLIVEKVNNGDIKYIIKLPLRITVTNDELKAVRGLSTSNKLPKPSFNPMQFIVYQDQNSNGEEE